jgi:hypothetical protein
MKTTIFAKYLAVVLAAGLASFAGTAAADIVSLDAPFTMSGSYGTKYLNFNGTSLTGSNSRGPNSATMQAYWGNLYFSDGSTASNYAYNGTIANLTFSYGNVVSAVNTDFSFSYVDTAPSDSPGVTYYVVGFYDNAEASSQPSLSAPNDAFIANSNLAWLAVSRNNNGDVTVEAAGINTVAGGSIAVGKYVPPSPSSVPEIDPNSVGSVLALVLGKLGLLERRRLKTA